MLISVVILTRNEEKHIEECLLSTKGLGAEIIIVDDSSTDQTVGIAQKHGASVFNRKLDSFSEQRNYGLSKCCGEWVLMLDADERLTPELILEVKQVVDGRNIDMVTAYAIPRKNHFLGKWIRNCGWYPDYTLRLFRRGYAQYVGIVHEGLEVQGSTGRLRQPLIHYTYNSLDQYMNKLNKYTTMAAIGMAEKGRNAGIVDLAIRPIFTFFKMFILKKGFLDGTSGLIISCLSAAYVFLKYAKLYYLKLR